MLNQKQNLKAEKTKTRKINLKEKEGSNNVDFIQISASIKYFIPTISISINNMSLNILYSYYMVREIHQAQIFFHFYTKIEFQHSYFK